MTKGEEILTLKKEGKSYKEISTILNISTSYISKLFRKEFPNYSTSRNTNNCNKFYFSNIDNEIKSYLLGFFAGDGHITKLKNCNSYQISIKVIKEDIEVLDLFNEQLSNKKLKLITTNNERCLTYSLSNLQIGKDLTKLGFDNHKTHTLQGIPKIPKEHIRHFIRGFFDADGSIQATLYNNKFGDYLQRGFSIASGNKNILESIVSNLPINKYSIRTIPPNSVYVNKILANFKESYQLQISKIENIKSLFNYLYQDSNYYLNRKYEKFKKATLTTGEYKKMYL